MASASPYRDRQVDRALVRAAMKTPLLDAETELELARAWRDHGDQKALHKLTQAYLRLVIAIAARFRTYGLPMSDLVQEGSVGLMQAAARFEPEREVRFSTYASWWIRSAIQDYILRNWSIVRTGTTAAQKALFFNLRRLRALIREDGAEHLSQEGRENIAKKLRVNVTEVEKMESRIAASDRSLNAQLSEEGDAEWVDLIADERPLPEQEVMETSDETRRHEWLDTALQNLSQRELIIIKQRRLQEDSQTLEALGQKLGISKERVRQIEQIALKKLKTALLDKVPDPVDAGLIDA
jgi:RNA polymerase sigma-32 factor